MMATKNPESIADRLKKIVDLNGHSYLEDEPYRVYKELVESGAADRKTAAAILHFFTSGSMISVDSAYDAEQVSKTIQRECSLNKRMADRLALIMSSLYSDDHRREWKSKNMEGLKQFLSEEFICVWNGFAVWDAGNGTVDCHYEANIVLMPTEAISEDKELAGQLKKNPYMTKEAIHDVFAKRLKAYLDHEFDYYCTCEDYYEPVVEDFGENLKYDLSQWSEENGFIYISFEGDGDDDGYEPKYRNNWY